MSAPESEPASRPSELRNKQRQLARETILRSVAEEIVERGLEELSLQAAADRAGVSKRTLYNYFASREELLEQLGVFSDEMTLAFGGVVEIPDLEALPDAIEKNYGAWTAQGPVLQAMLMVYRAIQTRDPALTGRSGRQDAIAAGVRSMTQTTDPPFSDIEVEAISRGLSSLISSSTYERLVIEDRMPPDHAAATIAWIIDLVLQALRRGSRPDLEGDD